MTIRSMSLVRAPLLAVTLATLLLGCEASSHSSAGFRLPAGDVAGGEEAFVALNCHACHSVSGMPDLPAPTIDPPVPVALGGEVPHVKTDGELVTSIINPSHRIARGYAPEGVTLEEGLSRMPGYRETMSVEQLIDVVAFLQSRYSVVRPGD